MRRFICVTVCTLASLVLVVLAVGLLGTGLGSTAASASASAGRACPADASGFVMYPFHGSLGDPAPALGVEPIWDIAVAGVEEEGLTVAELADSLKLDVNGLYNLWLGEWLTIDKNGDRNVCVQRFPQQGHGMPDYFFNFIDNNANVPR